MKIVIAPDSFKESLSAERVAEAISSGFKAVFPEAQFINLPVADGGEGTTESLVAATNGCLRTTMVTGPTGNAVEAQWGFLGDKRTAVIETAAASGLQLVSEEARNPMVATTRGTGELVLAALDCGAEKIVVGLGGSATNDGGAGMLQALGVQLLDDEGKEIPPGGEGLAYLYEIDTSRLDPRLEKVQFEVACDVDNPLTGENGASAVFGPQKGATPDMVRRLDANLRHYSEILSKNLGVEVDAVAGAGAAGGLGAAFLVFFNAQLKSGIEIVLDTMDIDRHLATTDLVITGEGRIDSQTVRGKTPIGVAKRAKAYGIPVIALAGSLSDDAGVVHQHGIDAIFSIVPGVVPLDRALDQAAVNLYRTARNIAAVWRLSQSKNG